MTDYKVGDRVKFNNYANVNPYYKNTVFVVEKVDKYIIAKKEQDGNTVPSWYFYREEIELIKPTNIKEWL